MIKGLLPLFVMGWVSFAAFAGTLETGFADPPHVTKPWCYWYWFNDNISKEGITHDLEAMARVGIGEALMANIFQPDYPAGNVKVLSEEWWSLVEHTIREGGRVGVDIGLFNCPGWSMSGGPWIRPEQSMRHLVSSEVRVTGPSAFAQRLPQPKPQFQDVAVLAFPAPQGDADSLASHAPKVTCTPVVADADKWVDGRFDAAVAFPPGAGQSGKTLFVEINVAEPFTARSLAVHPAGEAFGADCVLEAESADGTWQTLRTFKFDRSNMNPGVGPMPNGPVTVSFAPTLASKFRLAFSRLYFGRLQGSALSAQATLSEIELSGAARLEAVVEKQLGKMHPTPMPAWDSYQWPTPPEPDSATLTVPIGDVRDISAQLAADGTLRWDVPPGKWVILRTGMAPTGIKNTPASSEATGLEVDKMNRAAAKVHFDAFIGQVLRRMPAADRKAFKHVVADSYEVGSENWTDGFADTFRTRYGYDPKPWLPVLTGRLVGSADQSERFLWDLRRLVADRISADYVGGLRELCHEHGLKLWLENYGHWGFAGEFLQYGGQSDCVAGEFWTVKGLGSIEVRAATSCANTYGKPIAAAESFTSGPKFQTSPWGLKALGDWAFCEGINHFVLHVFLHQPWDERKPGVNAPWPTEFNRHNTWFDAGGAWVDYVRRCSFLLQQGNRIADVAYFVGEDAPKMTGTRQPELPPGRDFDYINAEVIQQSLSVKNGLLSLPHGTTYRVLVLPERTAMRPELVRKIRDLVKAGATVLGPPPTRSPSLKNYPQCDVEMRKLTAELWGDARRTASGEQKVGKGRVIWGKGLSEVLGDAGVEPDFMSETRLRYTHRLAGDTDIYFVANPSSEAVASTASFRVRGKTPALWRPTDGRIERLSVYDDADGVINLPLHLGPNGSVFVVFNPPGLRAANRIVSVTRNGEAVLDTKVRLPQESEVPSACKAVTNNFTFAVWAKPLVSTPLLAEANRVVCSEPRNDVITPPPGSSFGDSRHAGCGLSVACNGVMVFESAETCFAPVLTHGVSLTQWTHVTVVYHDGQPSLYLNGKFAHTGLRSAFLVHPGIGHGVGVMPFRGEFGNCQQFARPLSEAEVMELASTMPCPTAPTHPNSIDVVRGSEGGAEACVWQAGDYVLQMADGKQQAFSVPSLTPPLAISGPWEVTFDPKWLALGDGGQNAEDGVYTFETLQDWTQRSETGIKYYSGTAVYRKTFDLPSSVLSPLSSVFLDLGTVRDLATVRLNGQRLGTLWLAPWCVDITAAARVGENLLEIEVVNPWNNRLVADANLPPEKRLTFLLSSVVGKGAPLLPAGLLGPVTVQSAQRVVVK